MISFSDDEIGYVYEYIYFTKNMNININEKHINCFNYIYDLIINKKRTTIVFGNDVIEDYIEQVDLVNDAYAMMSHQKSELLFKVVECLNVHI